MSRPREVARAAWRESFDENELESDIMRDEMIAHLVKMHGDDQAALDKSLRRHRHMQGIVT